MAAEVGDPHSQIKDLLASLTTCSAEGEPDGSPRLS